MEKQKLIFKKIIKDVIVIFESDNSIFIQTENFEFFLVEKEDLYLKTLFLVNDRIQHLRKINKDIYFIIAPHCYIYHSSNLNLEINKKRYGNFLMAENKFLAISSEMFFSPLRFKYQLVDLLSKKEIFEIDNVKRVYILKDSLVFHDDIKLYFYYDIGLNDYKTCSLDFSTYLKKDNKKTISDYLSFNAITKYENQFIFSVNEDRIMSIDVNTCEVLWEIREYINETSAKKILVERVFFTNAVDNMVYILEGSLYIELDILKREAIVKKDFSITETYKSLVCYTNKFYENKIYALVNFTNPSHGWCYEFMVFNTDTKEVEQIEKVNLPRGAYLTKDILVDEKYVYLQDSEQNLYIYEKVLA